MIVKFTNQYITDVTFEHTVLAWRTQKWGANYPTLKMRKIVEL